MQAANSIYGSNKISPTPLYTNNKKQKTPDKKTHSEFYEVGLFKKQKDKKVNLFEDNLAETNIFSIEMEYVSINQGNPVSTEKNSLLKKVGAIMALPPIYTESFALAKEQVKSDAIDDLKLLGPAALVVHLLSVWFNISFFVILFFIFIMAACEFVFSLVQRFRLDGVDYAPIAKVQVLGGAFFFFIVMSFLQVALDYILITEYTIPDWAKAVSPYANIRNLTAVGILMFYGNTVRKMFLKGAGAQADEIPPIQINNNGQ